MGAEGGNDLLIASLAARQHGVLSSRQLRGIGLGAKAISYRVRRRRLIVIHRGVYAVGHARLHREGRWMAAVLACGPNAVLSHGDAAALWGLRPPVGRDVEVTIGRSTGLRSRAGIALHRHAGLLERETTVVEGIPVTTVARTLLDNASCVRPHVLWRMVEQADVLGLFDLAAVDAVLAAHHARPGAPALSAVLADMRIHGVATTRSDLEARFLQLCIERDLPRPRLNHRIDGRELDAVWPDAGVVVELNGYRYHRSRAAFERDHAKRLGLEAAGWTVLSLTHRQLTSTPDEIARRLRTLLSR
jgi:very-short-patch-repair endonuclease